MSSRGHARCDRPATANVKRCLFGAPDHEKVRMDLTLELAKTTAWQKQRWNFDFDTETPASGRYHWTIIPETDLLLEGARPEAHKDMPEFYFRGVKRKLESEAEHENGSQRVVHSADILKNSDKNTGDPEEEIFDGDDACSSQKINSECIMKASDFQSARILGPVARDETSSSGSPDLTGLCVRTPVKGKNNSPNSTPVISDMQSI